MKKLIQRILSVFRHKRDPFIDSPYEPYGITVEQLLKYLNQAVEKDPDILDSYVLINTNGRRYMVNSIESMIVPNNEDDCLSLYEDCPTTHLVLRAYDEQLDTKGYVHVIPVLDEEFNEDGRPKWGSVEDNSITIP